MQKITNLYRLNFSSKSIIIFYLLKRVFKFKTTLKERILNDYYFHLISFDGFLKEETDYYFSSYYPKWESKIRTRKRPSSDLDVFAQILNYLEYKPLVETFKANFVNRKELKIIDAGSNIGLTTLYLSRFFDDATFVCIEPNESNFEVLSFNLEFNSIENAQKIKGGVWSKNTSLKLVSDFRDKSDWCFRVEETDEKTDLEAFSIPYLIKKFNWNTIDILKIDIEGSEKEIFTNPTSDISFLAITKCIAIEIHDEFDCREAIYEILKQFNFEIFNTGELTIGVNMSLRDV
jgi:FkbM family methyltransferase